MSLSPACTSLHSALLAIVASAVGCLAGGVAYAMGVWWRAPQISHEHVRFVVLGMTVLTTSALWVLVLPVLRADAPARLGVVRVASTVASTGMAAVASLPLYPLLLQFLEHRRFRFSLASHGAVLGAAVVVQAVAWLAIASTLAPAGSWGRAMRLPLRLLPTVLAVPVIALVCVAGHVWPSSRDGEYAPLRTLTNEAHAASRDEVQLVPPTAEAIFPMADDLVRRYAITLVQGTHVTPQPVARGDEWIDTWSEVRVLRRYVDASPAGDGEPCDRSSPPRGIRLSRSTGAVTLPGGTVFYRGVRVTAIGPGLWFAFEPDARYLLFTGAPCDGRLVLYTPEVSVLRVSPDGRLTPVSSEPGGLPFTDIAAIDSLDTLESRLRAAGRTTLRETDHEPHASGHHRGGHRPRHGTWLWAVRFRVTSPL